LTIFITSEGQWKAGVYDMEEYRLDDILPGRLCILLYQKTGVDKYRKVADQFYIHLTKQPGQMKWLLAQGDLS